jgi:SOS-response transcriptional repressor LexA
MQDILVSTIQGPLVACCMDKDSDKSADTLRLAAIGDRIAAARKKKEMSQEQLGEALGVTPQAVQQWEAGETSPRTKRLSELARILDVSVGELWFGRGTRSSHLHLLDEPRVVEYLSNTTSHVPVISWELAGRWNDGNEPTLLKVGDIREPVEVPVNRRAFALKVRGDSMEPRFPDGCTIVVDPDVPVTSGDFVIAHAPGWHEATFKLYVVDAGIRYLKPLNPVYQTIQAGQDVSVIGKVIQWKIGGTLP